MNIISGAISVLSDQLVDIDWTSLKESALEAALEFAKAEAGEFTEYAKGKVKDGWGKVDWFGSRNKYKTNLLDNLSTTKILWTSKGNQH